MGDMTGGNESSLADNRLRGDFPPGETSKQLERSQQGLNEKFCIIISDSFLHKNEWFFVLLITC